MRPLPLSVLAALVLALPVAACGSEDEEPAASSAPSRPAEARGAESVPVRGTKPKVEIPDGPAPKRLQVDDLRPGTGAVAQPGDTLRLHYVGVRHADGKQFDASWDRREPFEFILQSGQVIPGWDEGLEGMKVGGRRRLTIPSELAYGAQGSPPAIPPNAPLVFVVDLFGVS